MNGKELKEYDYRLSLQSIDHLSVDGDLILNDIVSEWEEYGQNITVFFSALGRQILCQSMMERMVNWTLSTFSQSLMRREFPLDLRLAKNCSFMAHRRRRDEDSW
jgi:hypothetical protein